MNCCICNSTNNVAYWEAAYWCDDCKEKEMQTQKELEATTETRVRDMTEEHAKRIMTEAPKIDGNIKVNTDIFNAKTKAIIELEAAINADSSVADDEKYFELGKQLTARFNHLKQILFETQRDIENEQKAIQVRLNTLANNLRTEEREKLRLKDINYKVEPPKKIKPKKIKTKSMTQADLKELRKLAGELGIDMMFLRMLCIKRNLKPQEAADYWKKEMMS
jgi:hypothetical protein